MMPLSARIARLPPGTRAGDKLRVAPHASARIRLLVFQGCGLAFSTPRRGIKRIARVSPFGLKA
jgi:hypothetical protein